MMKCYGAIIAAGLAVSLCMPYGSAMAQAWVKPALNAGSARPGAAGKAITWKEALGRTGENVVVEGTIVGVKVRTGKAPDMLNFGENWKESLSVAIFEKEKFGNVQATYQGRKVRVRGRVSQYRNAAQIKVSDPAQITILE